MALKAVIETEDQIPEALRDHYSEKDGKFYLQAEGMKTEEDFNRYSDALKKRLADATSKLESLSGGLNRDDILAAIREAAGSAFPTDSGSKGKGGGSDDPKFHDLERQLAELKRKNEGLETELNSAKSDRQRVLIESQLKSAASNAGVRKEAVDNIVSLVNRDFELDSTGRAVVKVDGVNYEGVSPNMNPVDYFKARQADPGLSYFWPDSKGGGAGGGDSGGGAMTGKDNPWTVEGWNKTKQSLIVKNEPEKAKRLAAAAGVDLYATRPKKQNA